MGEKETFGTGERMGAAGGAIAIGEEGVQRSAGQGGGIAIDEEGVQRTAGGGGAASGAGYVQDNSPNAESERRKDDGSKDAERASNLNLSKSNIDRLAAADPGPEDAARVKGSKSSTSERSGDPGANEPEGAAERSNLNSSKSNTYRLAEGDLAPEDAAKVKGSKSNTSERAGDPGAGSPDPAESTNLNSSRSN